MPRQGSALPHPAGTALGGVPAQTSQQGLACRDLQLSGGGAGGAASGTGLPRKMLSVCFRSVDSGMVFIANAIISSLECHHTENCIRSKKEIHIYSFISKIYINYGCLLPQKKLL